MLHSLRQTFRPTGRNIATNLFVLYEYQRLFVQVQVQVVPSPTARNALTTRAIALVRVTVQVVTVVFGTHREREPRPFLLPREEVRVLCEYCLQVRLYYCTVPFFGLPATSTGQYQRPRSDLSSTEQDPSAQGATRHQVVRYLAYRYK